MYRDFYLGSGPSDPSITLRMERVEGQTRMLMAINEQREKKHETKMNILLGMGASILVTVIAAIILFAAHIK